MQIVNKISMKIVCGELKGKVNQQQDALEVVKILGVVKDKEEMTGIYGKSWKLKGEFKAINLLTQEEFFSNNCFLPSLAEDLVINQMDATSENAIQFAFVIGLKAAENKVGYEYTVKPLLKPAEKSTLALIENQILPDLI